ncbi:MAG: hypothetical protein ACKOBW_07930 [Planctomycetota bacterium]
MNQLNPFIAVSRLPQRLRWGWSLLLILLTWQGPVPLLHCHGAEANLASPDNEWLACHLCNYHLAALLTGAEVNGWHFHLAYPDSPNDDADHDSEGASKPSSRRVLMETGNPGFTRVISDGARAASGLITIDQDVEAATVITPTVGTGRVQRSGAFYTTFATALALPLRFGILRV